ncbi:MAG: type II secretion system protein GspM [Sutterellaceae bacterium]|nr:type II secretion system protein M [Burkholderiaceae bacterium]MDW8429945.1 type II secretion system protein GspM [Sutterellaceae bacterium]
MQALTQFWQERAPREKALLLTAAAVLLGALIYLLLIEPAVTGIARLQRGLPAARQQAAQLEALLAEVKSLKARPPVATLSPQETRAAIEKSLGAAGLKAARVVPLADGDLQLTFSNVPYAAWATWLAGVERELGGRAISVTANATGTPGHTDIELVLRLTRR